MPEPAQCVDAIACDSLEWVEDGVIANGAANAPVTSVIHAHNASVSNVRNIFERGRKQRRMCIA